MLLKQYHDNLTALSQIICGNIQTDHLCKLYREQVYKIQTHHGKKYMVRYMKDLNSIAERYAIYQPIEPIKFCKSDRDGFPSKWGLFKPYLRNEDQSVVKITLSIFRSVEMFRLPVSHDIESVVRPPQYNEEVVKDIIKYIPKFTAKLPKLSIGKLGYHFTVKNGPNGPALSTSDCDLSAVRQDVAIYNALRTVSSKLNDMDFPSENYQTTKIGIHSRLTQFSEKAGKTRTIAVIDYYSQRALRPLHKALMALLRGLSSDGTYSHMNVGNYAKEATKNASFIETSDMTAFTDLFPAILQYNVLTELVKDRDLSEAWWTLLAKRHFTLAWSGDDITYGTGQPMGAYASWALCTITHHAVMHYCAYKIFLSRPNSHYRIIGDDNARTNQVLSRFYEETLLQLGCKLNPNKGTCSTAGAKYSGAEVAKRLYLNGKDLSPLTPGLIKSLRSLHLLNSSIKELITTFENPALPICILDKFIPKDKREKGWMLCTNPYDGAIKPGMPGYDEHSHIWSDVIQEYDYRNINRLLRIHNICDKAWKLNDEQDLFMRANLQFSSQVVKNSQGIAEDDSVPHFAVNKCSHQLELSFYEAIAKLDQQFDDESNYDLSEVEYLPNSTDPFKDQKDLRNTHASLLVMKCFDFMQASKNAADLERWILPPAYNVMY